VGEDIGDITYNSTVQCRIKKTASKEFWVALEGEAIRDVRMFYRGKIRYDRMSG
jgi:hypothetical protein